MTPRLSHSSPSVCLAAPAVAAVPQGVAAVPQGGDHLPLGEDAAAPLLLVAHPLLGEGAAALPRLRGAVRLPL